MAGANEQSREQFGKHYGATLAAAVELGFFTRMANPTRVVQAVAALSGCISVSLLTALVQQASELQKSLTVHERDELERLHKNEFWIAPDDREFHRSALVLLADQAVNAESHRAWYVLGCSLGAAAVASVGLDGRWCVELHQSISAIPAQEMEISTELRELAEAQGPAEFRELLQTILLSEHVDSKAVLGFCDRVVESLRNANIAAGEYSDPLRRARDEWLHSKYLDGLTYETILRQLNKHIDGQAEKWPRIRSKSAVRRPIRKYHRYYFGGELPKRPTGPKKK